MSGSIYLARSNTYYADQMNPVLFSVFKHMLKLGLLFGLILFAGCEHETSTNLNALRSGTAIYLAPKDICGEIIFQEKIADNVQGALDEILARKIELGLQNIFLETQKLREVKDQVGQTVNLEFYVVIVMDQTTGLKAHAWHEVIDETGNLYFIDWCPD